MSPSPNGSHNSPKKIDVTLYSEEENAYYIPDPGLPMDPCLVPSAGDEVWTTGQSDDGHLFVRVYKVERRKFNIEIFKDLPDFSLTNITLICKCIHSA
jgi:hypothetical protein